MKLPHPRARGPAPPLPERDERWALFLDLDGTLAEIAGHPDEVCVHQRLPPLLRALRETLDGALAVVSGRPVGQVDRIVGVRGLVVAGLHGLQIRPRGGASMTTGGALPSLDAPRATLAATAASDPRLLLEDKGVTLALHYRLAPELEGRCRAAAQAAAAADPALHVLAGKMVFEVKPRGMHKGAAIASLLGRAPFHGRLPVFAGDDRTDEDGFRAVQARGGIGVKVGAGASCARHRVADVAALHAWLAAIVRAAGAGHV